MSGIVIIEQDPFIRSLLVEWLTADGYRVHATDDHDGQRLSDAGLLIVDVYMPRHLGAARLRWAKQTYPGIPIIAISAQFHAGLNCAGTIARALGVERVIAKPFDRDALLHAVRSVIDSPALDTG
jgi:CheY-like chemotaxis protein